MEEGRRGLQQVTKNPTEEGLIHEFWVLDPTGTNDFQTNRTAEGMADQWLAEHEAKMRSLVRDREESLENGVVKVHYKLFGDYVQ